MKRDFPLPLPNGWYGVGYAEDLAAGDLVPLHYFGRDLVMFRDDRGRAVVFDAYCPHLGANLGRGGRVENGVLRCPFHHWEFDGSGRCVRVPYATRIPPKARLSPWPVVERSGLVLVWFHKQGASPDFDVPEVPEFASDEWTDPYRREWTVRSRNQDLAENSVDPAHFRYVHGTAELPTIRSWAEGAVFRADLDYPIGEGEHLQHGKIEIHAHGYGFGLTRFRGIVDTTVVVTGTPIDEERVHQRLSFLVRKLPDAAATDAIGRAFVDEIARQFDEDIPIWENKTYWEKPVLCDGDGPIAELRRWGRRFE